MSAAAQTVARESRVREPGAIRWVAIGDSFTAGLTDGDPTWTRIVHRVASCGRPTGLDNLARVGATTADVERDQVPAAIAAKPDLLTLICGANDVITAVRPSAEGIAENLDRIWSRLRSELPATILLTATYPAIAPEAVRPRTRQRIERGFAELNASLRETASRHGVVLVEMADHPGEIDRHNYAADGIHPSPAGHRAAARVIAVEIEALLRERERTRDEEGR